MNAITDFDAIAALDLDPIKVKIMHQESGEGWSLDKVNAVEFEYRRFLYLMKKFPQEQTAPLFDVDTFWHYHILDTMKYAQDCETVFGYFLHHFPYIGLRGEEDEAAHERVGQRMKELYEETFGESYEQAATAFSGSTVAGFSGSTTTAFSGSTKTAFSGSTKTAFSGSTKTAFSGSTVKMAFSGSTAQTAFSGSTVKYAFSGSTVQSDFYSARPRLPATA